MKKIFALIALAVLSSIALSACVDQPERAAREWFDAMLSMDGNKILERTCDAQVETIQTIGIWISALAILPQLFGMNIESQGDISDIGFSTTDRHGDTAYIHVYGEMRVAVLAFAQAYPIDETWIMAKEDGEWKWCGIQ